MKKYLIMLILLLMLPLQMEARRSRTAVKVADNSGREFRGTWIQTAFQERYQKMSPEQARKFLIRMVEDLDAAGFNAILFQVRPEGDAFYSSSIEPWSRFLTGRQGQAPSPEWDPMQFMIQLCHQHAMEFHAWINPYRMSASKTLQLAQNHLYYQHPEWFVRFDDKLYLNPGLPECRSYVREVVRDIVARYDIDAIHIDDYFYPYPVAGKTFDDRAAFDTYAPVFGFDVASPQALGDFRRRNVDILIKSLHDDIHTMKPWVRFGVSPFGIYRNQKSWAEGSATNGTQCYDDLYADVLLWARNGWIDYVIPQLYWEIGHKAADYSTLVKWWNEAVPATCHLYIGQSIERSLDPKDVAKKSADLTKSHQHFGQKLSEARACGKVLGNCFWYAYQVEDNAYHAREYLQNVVWQRGCLPPAYSMLDDKRPSSVKGVETELTAQGVQLSWTFPETADPLQQSCYFCIYRFAKGEKSDVKDASHLIGKTTDSSFLDASALESTKYTYAITAVDLCNNESQPVKKSVKIKK